MVFHVISHNSAELATHLKSVKIPAKSNYYLIKLRTSHYQSSNQFHWEQLLWGTCPNQQFCSWMLDQIPTHWSANQLSHHFQQSQLQCNLEKKNYKKEVKSGKISNTFDFGYLSYQTSNSSGSSTDHNYISFFGLTDFQKTKVCSISNPIILLFLWKVNIYSKKYFVYPGIPTAPRP